MHHRSALIVAALSLVRCDSPARGRLNRPAVQARTSSSGASARAVTLIAINPYRVDRPFETHRRITLDASVAAALAPFATTLCEPERWTNPFLSFDCGGPAGPLSGEVRVSPRITALRHGSTLLRLEGPANANEPPTALELVLQKPASGFVDAHTHPWAALSYDRLVVWGQPWCPLETDARQCPANHRAHLGATHIATQDVHGPAPAQGYPSFADWPRWDSWTHMVSHPAMLYRAVQGGLRLIVALAVNNYSGCVGAFGFSRGQDSRCADDDLTVIEQIRAAYWTQALVDAQSGGEGRGWFRIVRTPREARQVMSEGKLAVVLGVEVDSPFGCGSGNPQCTIEYLRRRLDEAYACGVRHFFPIHFWDNAIGATGLQHQLSGPATSAVASSDPRYEWQGARHIGDRGRLPWPDSLLEGVGAVNRGGLTLLGRQFIRALMERRMMIDVDHQSDQSTRDVLSIVDDADARWAQYSDRFAYPVVGGHITTLALTAGEARQEGQMTPEELGRIRDVGGMVAVITRPAKDRSWQLEPERVAPPYCQASQWACDSLAFDESGTSQSIAHHLLAAAAVFPSGVGIGTDFNGGNIQVAPRRRSMATWSYPFALHERSRERPSQPTRGWSASAFATERWTSPAVPFARLEQHRIFARGTSDVCAPSTPEDQQRAAPAHVFDYTRDGLAHAGMLPDLIRDLLAQGVSNTVIDGTLRSAEEYVSVWERAEIAAERLNLAFPTAASARCRWDINARPECQQVQDVVRYGSASYCGATAPVSAPGGGGR
jgi:microsomal dipeptidase-like Zn-dependent dipeptidase